MKMIVFMKWIAKGGVILVKFTGIVACLIWFAAGNSKMAAMIKGKRKKQDTKSALDLTFIHIPEVGKKIQQSFRKPVFF